MKMMQHTHTPIILFKGTCSSTLRSQPLECIQQVKAEGFEDAKLAWCRSLETSIPWIQTLFTLIFKIESLSTFLCTSAVTRTIVITSDKWTNIKNTHVKAKKQLAKMLFVYCCCFYFWCMNFYIVQASLELKFTTHFTPKIIQSFQELLL